MGVLDSQQCTIAGAEQFILVDQFKPRVEVVLVEKVDSRFSRVAVEIVPFTRRVTGVVASPDKSRRPVAAVKWFVVLHRCGCSMNVGGRVNCFGASQEA